MTVYEVERNVNAREIKKGTQYFEGVVMRPKLRARDDFIEVKEIVIVNPKLKKKVLKMQFHVAYKRLLKMVMDVSGEDASDADIQIAFSEIERMKRVLKDEYQKHLQTKEYYTYFEKACFLEKQLRAKVIEQQQIKEMIYRTMMFMGDEENKKRSR